MQYWVESSWSAQYCVSCEERLVAEPIANVKSHTKKNQQESKNTKQNWGTGWTHREASWDWWAMAHTYGVCSTYSSSTVCISIRTLNRNILPIGKCNRRQIQKSSCQHFCHVSHGYREPLLPSAVRQHILGARGHILRRASVRWTHVRSCFLDPGSSSLELDAWSPEPKLCLIIGLENASFELDALFLALDCLTLQLDVVSSARWPSAYAADSPRLNWSMRVISRLSSSIRLISSSRVLLCRSSFCKSSALELLLRDRQPGFRDRYFISCTASGGI